MASPVTYYFNDNHASELWETTPENMVDGTDASYAATTTDGQVHRLIGNNCPGTDLGTITKVELRFYGYGDVDDQTILRPVFGGSVDGDNHVVVPGTTPEWKAYQDITTDTNAPSWTWAAVVALDCDVEMNDIAKGNTAHVGEVEIRVTYTPYPSPPTSLASPSQTDTTIDLTWTKGANSDKTLIRFNTGAYPTGVADGYGAYFDTGESATIQPAQTIIQDLSAGNQELDDISYNRAGQRINDFPVSTITQLSFYLNKYGSPSGSFYVRIRKVSDDGIVGTVATVTADDLTTGVTRYDYECEIENATKQDLRFTVEYADGDISNYVSVWLQTGDIVEGFWTRYDASWTDSSNYDCAFRISYSLPHPQSATTYYIRAWGYQTATTLYSVLTADLTQATSGAEGWTHKFLGVANASIAKINGVAIADILKVNGVE